ncbi:MAG TPA: sigma-70 family RNA polymerase sigma factor [Opitutaceae bacterium]|nr:sigma-70 family RNA polymerase sigma factor [Opitutaceae bacterium]
MIDDAELLRRYAQTRDEAAFAELVRRHLGFVYAAALRQVGGGAHRAEDVTQSVFVDLARKAATLAMRAEIAGWLYTSTHHAAAKLKRGEQRRQAREEEANRMQEIHPATAATDWEKLRPVLDDAMHELPEPDRRAILLRFFQDRRFTEIGTALGASEDAARMRVERALEKLRAALARREITSTVAALGLLLANQPAVATPAPLAAGVTSAALASAAGGAGLAATAMIFMSKTTTIVGVIVLAAGIVGYEAIRRQRAEAEVAALVRERDALRAQLNAMPARNASARASAAAMKPAPVATAAAQAEIVGASGRPTAEASPTEEDAKARAVAAALAAQAKRMAARVGEPALETTYRPLFRQLGFSPEQIERFKTLMAHTQQVREQLIAELQARGAAVDETTLQVVRDRTEAEFEASMQSEFGEATERTFVHFQETLPLRGGVELLEKNLFYTETPLTAPQAEQMLEIVARTGLTPEGKIDWREATEPRHYDEILAQASAVLSPPQLAMLRQMFQRELAERAANAAAERKPGAEKEASH